MSEKATKDVRFRVKTVKFVNGERCPAIADEFGMLVGLPNVYALVVLRPPGGSAGSIEGTLRSIAMSLTWASERGIDLAERAQHLTLLRSSEIEDLKDSLRKRTRSAATSNSPDVGAHSYVQRCAAFRDYFSWIVRDVIQKLSPDDFRLGEARIKLEDFTRGMMAGLPKPRAQNRKGLDGDTQALFLNAIEPGHPLNPFQLRHQPRNHLLFRLYYETSIRRAELLKLRGEDLIDLHGSAPRINIRRRPDDVDDPRIQEPRVKTQERELPISRGLADSLYQWIVRQRSDAKIYGAAKRSPYIFVARTGQPLSMRTVNDMFERLRGSIPGLSGDFFPHILRHTGNDRFSEEADKQGLTEAAEIQARNYAMGWTKNSQQGVRYCHRHTEAAAHKIIVALQNEATKKEIK